MEQKTMKIKRLIEVELIVPTEETKEEAEQWMDGIIASGCSMESSDTDHIIRSIRTVQKDEDDQDSFIVVSWPESQELCEWEGYEQNCSFVMGDSLECCSYLVNKDWYGRMKRGELKPVEEYAEL